MTADHTERNTQASDIPDFRIVAIGASAGGLESLERLFTHLPPDTGMAFVVLQHLSPDFKSLMDELLSRRTQMRIRLAEHDMGVEPNTVYLLPPTSDLRFNWVVARMDQLDHATMEERVCDAWAMCVPKFLVRERFGLT